MNIVSAKAIAARWLCESLSSEREAEPRPQSRSAVLFIESNSGNGKHACCSCLLDVWEYRGQIRLSQPTDGGRERGIITAQAKKDGRACQRGTQPHSSRKLCRQYAEQTPLVRIVSLHVLAEGHHVGAWRQVRRLLPGQHRTHILKLLYAESV